MKLFYSRQLARDVTLRRRTFLTAVGLGIAAPLALKMSKLAVAQSTGRPNRLFIMFLPHGVPAEHWEVGENMDLTMSGVGAFAPLEPYRKYLQVLRGLGNYVDTNHAAISSMLTGKKEGGGANSLDYLVATALGTTPHVLGVQPYRANSSGPDHDSQVAHHGGWVTPVINPADALDDLFAGLAIGDSSSGPVDEAQFRAEALQLTEAEVAAMQTGLAGLTTESNKLQVHLESLRSVRAAQQGTVTSAKGCEGRPSLPTAESMKGKDPWDMKNFATILDGHLEATANAFLCGTAQVVTLQCMYANAQLSMDFPGGPALAKNHHDPLSHSWDAAGRREFATVQQWFYARLADKFLSVLDQPDPADPTHTVLDNTTIMTCTDIADGAQHNGPVEEVWLDGKPVVSSQPWLLIGGGGGYLGGGRAVTLQEGRHTDLLATVAGSMGVPLSNIGGVDTTEIAGVKA